MGAGAAPLSAYPECLGHRGSTQKPCCIDLAGLHPTLLSILPNIHKHSSPRGQHYAPAFGLSPAQHTCPLSEVLPPLPSESGTISLVPSTEHASQSTPPLRLDPAPLPISLVHQGTLVTPCSRLQLPLASPWSNIIIIYELACTGEPLDSKGCAVFCLSLCIPKGWQRNSLSNNNTVRRTGQKQQTSEFCLLIPSLPFFRGNKKPVFFCR